MVRNDAVDVLVQAARLIADPERWTQGALALDEIGDSVHPENDFAVRWCGYGAILAVVGDSFVLDMMKAEAALREAADDLFGTVSIGEINDFLGHWAIMTCYRHAIAKLEAECG